MVEECLSLFRWVQWRSKSGQWKRGLLGRATNWSTSGRRCRVSLWLTLWSCLAATVASTAGCVRVDARSVERYLRRRHSWWKARGIPRWLSRALARRRPIARHLALLRLNAHALCMLLIGWILTTTTMTSPRLLHVIGQLSVLTWHHCFCLFWFCFTMLFIGMLCYLLAACH